MASAGERRESRRRQFRSREAGQLSAAITTVGAACANLKGDWAIGRAYETIGDRYLKRYAACACVAGAEEPRADKGDKVLINTHLDKALIAEVDEFRWSNRIEGRAETIRQLIVRGLHPGNVAS